jgi:hypothetical protein
MLSSARFMLQASATSRPVTMNILQFVYFTLFTALSFHADACVCVLRAIRDFLRDLCSEHINSFVSLSARLQTNV